MKKALKIIGAIVVVFLFIVAGLAVYVKYFLPNVGPAPEITAIPTPDRMARGDYLANHVTVCIDCHSARDWNKFSGPIIPGSFGKGGEKFDQTMGFPGEYYAPNITPAGIGDWTDGEIFRAITTGVRKNGKPIFPVMPHDFYRLLDEEDIKAIIVYIRSLPPIENKARESRSDFPMNFLINTIPSKAALSPRPSSSNTLKYGEYLVTAASCKACHTPFDKGKFNEAFAFAGGRSFPMPAGLLTSSNITPDRETGIGAWTKSMFIEKFSFYRDSARANEPVNILKEYNTIMPWIMYSGMSDEDLGAIYDYLQSLPPVKHGIEKFAAHPRKG
ncbi:MAG: cytochrome c [Chitinophagaceae bacterium]|nr:cytochrome c [Chitinophagaceae bacterium]